MTPLSARGRARWLGATACTAWLAATSSQALAEAPIPSDAPVRTYIVQPGDSAWSIAEQFFGSGERYPIIYQFNNFVAAPPFLLKPGETLRLPIIGRGPEAEVAWLVKDVKAKPPRAVDWLAAREQMSLWTLYRVSTGDASAAHIVFDDKSDLRLREQALLVIYGASASAARTSRQDKTEIELEQGTIIGGLAVLDAAGQNTFKVKTRSGAVDVFGKAIQIQADAAATMVSAFLGSARVVAQGSAVTVQESQGTIVERGRPPEPPRPLPKAPRWLDAAGKPTDDAPAAIVALLPGLKADWEAAWEAVPRGARYRVELATDKDFHQVVYDVEVGAGVTRMKLADLKKGRYYVRLGTRDERMLESKPAAPRQLDIVPIELARAAVVSSGGVLEVVGYSRVAAPQGFLLRDSAAPPDTKPGSVVRLVTPGRHDIDLYTNESPKPARLKFEVIPVTPRLAAPTPANPTVPREPHVDPLKIGIKLIDARGRLATLPNVTIEQLGAEPGDPAAALPVRMLDGVYLTEVAPIPAKGPDKVALRVRWPGGVLGEASLPVELLLAPEDAGIYDWQPALARPERGIRGWAQPAPLAPAETRMGVAVGVAGRDPTSGLVDLVVSGEVPIGDHLALWGDFAFQSIWFDDQGAGQSHMGDVQLGGRWRLAFGSLTLAPYARLGIPAGRGEIARLLTLEPGVTARLELAPGLLLDGRFAFTAATDFGRSGAAALAGSVAITWRPGLRASLSLGWETQGMVWADGGTYASGALLNSASLGAGFYFGRARLALSVGMGIGDETEARLGLWLVRAVLDIGLGGD